VAIIWLLNIGVSYLLLFGIKYSPFAGASYLPLPYPKRQKITNVFDFVGVRVHNFLFTFYHSSAYYTFYYEHT
jgi:hypothetical protein